MDQVSLTPGKSRNTSERRWDCLHKTIREINLVYKELIGFAPCEETICWVVRPSVLVWTVDTEHSGYKTMEYTASFHVVISLLPHGLGTRLIVYLSLLYCSSLKTKLMRRCVSAAFEHC